MNRPSWTMLSVAALGTAIYASAASAAGISGHYLLTLKGHPTSENGTQYCATIVEDGGTENYRESGTVTLQDAEGRAFTGTWYASHHVALFEVPLPETSNSPSFIVFSARLALPSISGAFFTEVLNGAPAFDGSFTAVQNGCS